MMDVFERISGKQYDVLYDSNHQLILLATIFALLGNGLVSPILESLTGPFGVSATEIGIRISLFTVPAIFLIPALGVIADRYGWKPVLVGSITLFGSWTHDFDYNKIHVNSRFLTPVGEGICRNRSDPHD